MCNEVELNSICWRMWLISQAAESIGRFENDAFGDAILV